MSKRRPHVAADQTIYCPPLIDSGEPEMAPASSAARNSTARAISSGSPSPPTGMSGRMVLSRRAEPAHGNERRDAFVQHILGHRLYHFGIDVARTDRIHGDAAFGILQRQRLGEADIAGLGRGIVHLSELALLAVDRGYVDDAAEFARAHALDHLTRHVEQRAEIGVDDRVPLIDRHLVERAVAGDAGVIDEYIDRTKLGFHLFHAGGAGVERTDVPLVNGNAGVGFELVGSLIVAGISSRHVVTGSLQRFANRRADAPRPARYQCNTCHIVSFPRLSLTYFFT